MATRACEPTHSYHVECKLFSTFPENRRRVKALQLTTVIFSGENEFWVGPCEIVDVILHFLLCIHYHGLQLEQTKKWATNGVNNVEATCSTASEVHRKKKVLLAKIKMSVLLSIIVYVTWTISLEIVV